MIPGRDFSNPIFLTGVPAPETRLVVVEQTGRIKAFAPGAGVSASRIILDVSARIVFGGEQGLLGLAFDPDFAANRFFYVNYTRSGDGAGFIRLLFKVADTQEPNYTGAPALATLSGNTISNVQPFPGFDGRNSSNYSIYNKDFLIRNTDGVLERVEMSGITTKAFSLGGQLGF